MLTNVRKSKEHLIYDSLRSRKELSKDEWSKYRKLQVGYEGEVKLAALLEKHLTVEHIVFFGIVFDYQSSITQIDCYIILSNKMLLIEVKNFQGEYELNDGVFTSLTTSRTYQNPLYQLHRAENNMMNLFNNETFNLPLESYVVFVNNQFSLYTKKNEQIILPTYIDKFLQGLNNGAGTLTEPHHRLARQLATQHLDDNPLERTPIYNFQSLRKGIHCPRCGQPTIRIRNRITCPRCHIKENFKTAIIRNAHEFHLLFPTQPITTDTMYQWMGKNISKPTIRKTLSSYLNKQNKTKNVHYLLKLQL